MAWTTGRCPRRVVLARAAQAAMAGMVLGGRHRTAAEEQVADRGPRALEPGRYVIWDAHGHLSSADLPIEQQVAALLSVADRMGIARLVVCMGYPWAEDPAPEEMRRQNDQVWRALEAAPGRLLGFVYLNPNHTRASLDELDRCVRDGPMVGVKLWIAVRCHDPRLDPLVRRAAELHAPILQHTWQKVTGNLPGESTAGDLATLAARHPHATFIAAHAGGEWELGLRMLRDAPNVTADVCGSDPASGFVEMAVRELGAERVIYGSDHPGRSFASQLAKVLGADLPEPSKRLILAGNLQRMLAPILATKAG